ncbi:MAG: CcoQ/FixQ family Cbb3-type cytochrome c oxidase assembly chaperone [Sneathiellaceae bacterium]
MSVSHDFLVLLAKTFGLFWMMAFFLIVVVLAYRPGARARHARAAQSVLLDSPPEARR